MEKLKQAFSHWTKLDWAWLIVANATILGLGLYWGDGPIALISAITGVTCVIFVSKQMIANYYVGAINVALYAFLSYESKLYGDALLNAFYYFPMQFIGIYMWKKAKDNSQEHEVESKALTAKQRFILTLFSVIAIYLFSLVLDKIGGHVPLFDSASTVLSIIAMYLMVKQYLEQWYLWVIVNIISITMWAISLSQGSGDYATLLMWVIYLLNSLYGLYHWRKANKGNK